MPSVKAGHFKLEKVMKKLLLFLFLAITLPTLTMDQPYQSVEMYITDPVTRERVSALGLSTVNIWPDNKKVIEQIMLSTDNKSDRYSEKELEMHRYRFKPQLINESDLYGRTAIWWAAALNKDKEYDALLRLGANPNIKPNTGPLNKFSAKDLHNMNSDLISAEIMQYQTNRTPSTWTEMDYGMAMDDFGGIHM